MLDVYFLDEDLEKTQELPVLASTGMNEHALDRERSARIEIVEILRENAQQARELAQFRRSRDESCSPTASLTQSLERRVTTEEKLHAELGALKETLAKVLSECKTRGFALSCESAAYRTLEDSGAQLEQARNGPELLLPVDPESEVMNRALPTQIPVEATMFSPLKSFMTSNAPAPSGRIDPLRVSRLAIDWS